MEWQSINESAKTGKKLLLSLINVAGKRRAIVGFWVDKYSTEYNGDFDLEDPELDEKDGTYYWLEGWYESMESHDDFYCLYADQDSITHFMPLPPFPKIE